MGKSPGLVITLIVFIILTLMLGVASYFLAQSYQETVAKLTQAEEKAQNAEGEIRKVSGQIDKIKEKVGYPGSDADALLQEMDNDIKNALGDVTEIPKDYKGAIVALATNLQQKNSDLEAAVRQRDEFRVVAAEQENKARQQKEEFDGKVGKLTDEFKARDTEAAARYDELSKSNLELVKKIETIEKEAKQVNEEYRVQTADANETAAAVAQINVSLRDKLDQMSQAEFEVPDGKIIYVDQLNRKVRLNIGRAEGVRLLTNFSVFPYNAVELGVIQPKGSVEITRIVGDHESEARIISDEMTNPFLPNDLIYTPLWKTGDKVKFALDYFLDVNKDGKNDIDLMVNLINMAGSSVAAWIDENGEIHGEITPDISYFIIGNESLIDMLDTDNTKTKEVKAAIQKAHTEMFEKVRLNSVREVRLSEFLRRVNYRSTADVAKYQEQGGVTPNISTPGSPIVSKANVAPIYIPGEKGAQPVSQGLTAPIYGKGSGGQVIESPGKVSDFYFQKRNPGL